jgi:hypothetical protein
VDARVGRDYDRCLSKDTDAFFVTENERTHFKVDSRFQRHRRIAFTDIECNGLAFAPLEHAVSYHDPRRTEHDLEIGGDK